jgi:hypothetical protein
MLGYGKIPELWKEGLAEVESLDFKYTTISLADVYDLSFKHALGLIGRNGGAIEGQTVRIKTQPPKAVPLEVGFEGHYPKERRPLDVGLNETTREAEFSFDGIGFAVNGEATKSSEDGPDVDFQAEMTIDREPAVISTLPTADRTRKPTLFWRYRLKPGQHRVLLKILNPSPDAEIHLADVVIYGPSTSSR